MQRVHPKNSIHVQRNQYNKRPILSMPALVTVVVREA